MVRDIFHGGISKASEPMLSSDENEMYAPEVVILTGVVFAFNGS